jgi:hypothetical protein
MLRPSPKRRDIPVEYPGRRHPSFLIATTNHFIPLPLLLARLASALIWEVLVNVSAVIYLDWDWRRKVNRIGRKRRFEMTNQAYRKLPPFLQSQGCERLESSAHLLERIGTRNYALASPAIRKARRASSPSRKKQGRKIASTQQE